MGVLAGCGPAPGERLQRRGDEIVAAGQLFHTGTPVVLWIDPKGYDAYNGRCHFTPDRVFPTNPADEGNPNRYGRRRDLPESLAEDIEEEGWTLKNLQEQVDQFVIHYDVCGTSRRCFQVLQDMRGLSVHFMLDVDGTIYQTLDLKERAWHAGTANCRSVGVEIANMGAYPDMKVLDQWYGHDEQGWPYITFPQSIGETGIRTPNFVARPARKELIKGCVQGRELMQYDFTEEQYQALIKLTAALARVLPKMKLDVPRTEDGEIRTTALSAEELDAYSGLLGHLHVTTNKVDPGPAFDWERVLKGARRELAWTPLAGR
jgi:N-acetyl-anhydromuramyl-L-alanine amidase AmpD